MCWLVAKGIDPKWKFNAAIEVPALKKEGSFSTLIRFPGKKCTKNDYVNKTE